MVIMTWDSLHIIFVLKKISDYVRDYASDDDYLTLQPSSFIASIHGERTAHFPSPGKVTANMSRLCFSCELSGRTLKRNKSPDQSTRHCN